MKIHINSFSVYVTFTSEVSLWLFLQDLATEEKVRSGWSNLPSFAFRKNVVKGSCSQWNEDRLKKTAKGIMTQVSNEIQMTFSDQNNS